MQSDLDKEKLSMAIYSTFKRRNTLILLDELNERFNIISKSIALREYWENYQRKNYYARNIMYEDFVISINNIIKILEETKQPV